MTAASHFIPLPSLLPSHPLPRCRAVVIVPARNEEATLPAALDALAAQVDVHGQPLADDSFEIILLLNNCTDGSAAVSRRWQHEHPRVTLHIAERTLPPQDAHIGMARRLLLDTAWCRLIGQTANVCGMLSTDADTLVAPNWIAGNLRALEKGADAVGGMICLPEEEVAALPPGAREAYRRDRRYEALVAELEDLLDPQAGGPWPRHLQHVGASLACTPAAYARTGGLPVRRTLEDVAFVDALRRIDARVRHEPSITVSTSARLSGRVEVGLSAQLETWQRMHETGEAHLVPSAAFLTHRFRMLRCLRRFHARAGSPMPALAPEWQHRLVAAQELRLTPAAFLGEIDCDALVAATFRGVREETILQAIAHLSTASQEERMRQGRLPRHSRVEEAGSRLPLHDAAAS